MKAPGEVERAAQAILAGIVDGTYPPGLRLPPESELAARLGVGRSTLREALSHLATLGLVKSRRGSGVLVLDFRKEATLALLPAWLAAGRFEHPLADVVAEMLRVRTMLACEAVRLAATYATPSDLAAARAILVDLARFEHDPPEFTLRELELFRALVHASRMWPAVWLGNSFWPPMREICQRFAGPVGWTPRGHVALLGEVLALVEEGEAEKATRMLRAQFEKIDRVVDERLRALLGEPAKKKGAARARAPRRRP